MYNYRLNRRYFKNSVGSVLYEGVQNYKSVHVPTGNAIYIHNALAIKERP